MGYKTIRLEELEQRVAVYWIPSDYDPAAAADQLASLARRWPGFVRLTFDDETQVLTSVDYRFESGAFQSVWTTGQRPADVVAAAQGGQAAQDGGQAGAGPAATFDEMWQTYQGWTEYLEYSASTYRTENPHFLAAVYEYDQSPSAEKFQEIWDTYLAPDASELVHVDESLLETIRARTPGEQYAFEEARQAVYADLRDSYQKFKDWYRANYG